MRKQNVKACHTLVKFGIPRGEYRAGEGATTTFDIITASAGKTPGGGNISTDCFYVEWLGAYGTQALQAQQSGVVRLARVRMPFVRCVYEALNTKGCKIFLRGIQDAAHTYELASDADDYLQENAMLEFQVRHFEGK